MALPPAQGLGLNPEPVGPGMWLNHSKDSNSPPGTGENPGLTRPRVARSRKSRPFRHRTRPFRSSGAGPGARRLAMAPGVARRARRRVRGAPPAGSRGRSAEDWWWDRLAPSGSGYHLLQSDSMLLVLPGPGPARARAHRRVARRSQRLPPLGARAAAAKARPRPAPAPVPAPPQAPDPGWGDRIPLEILLQIFGLLVAVDGPMPFLGRAARVCRRWHEAASQPALWHTVTLSPPLAGRPTKGGAKAGGAKAEEKLLASLECLMPSRFSQLQKLTLIHWKSQVHSVLKVESTAMVSFLEEVGPRMRKLWLTYNSQTTAILGALLGSCCPQLQVLEVSSGINPNNTPLQLPVEALQKGCPQLQVLRLLNLMWLPKPSGRVGTPGPGFPNLEELCLAGPTCSFVSDEALGRLLRGSPNLRLLDLRGCARITPAGLCDLPCQELQQLHLGLYGMSDRLTLAKEGSPLLTHKWCHTLRELDLSGQGFSEKDLEQALAVFSGAPGHSHASLCSLNLRGTRVTPSTVSSVISSCPGLLYLNLESCRCLPRGLKRAYRGPEEVRWCLEQLLTSPPSPS
nr:PREDICTED: F-box/LRR-repeat protein 6 isoform X2 [Rhinolophus sinicus]